MKETHNNVLVIDNKPEELGPLLKLLTEFGWNIDIKKPSLTLSSTLLNINPDIIIINTAITDCTELAISIKTKSPDVYLIALTDKDPMDRSVMELRDQIYDIISTPLNPSALGMVLKRADHFARLQNNLKKNRSEIATSAQKIADERVETERFLAVHQVIDRMSSFLVKVIEDIHGGIKYFNELPFFVSIHDRELRILAANPAYYKHIGNMIHHKSWEIYTGKRATRNACPVGLTLNTGTVKSTRALVKYKSGAKVPVTVHTYPIYNNEGDVEFALEVFAGAKEVKDLAHEIHSTQQRYQLLFDSVPNHIAVLDRRFHLTAINKKFKTDFGDHTDKNFFDVLRPAVFPAYRDPITQTVRKGTPHQGEMIMIDQNGIQYNMMAWTSPIKTAAGKLIQVLVIFADITELRKLQTNLAAIGLMVSTVSHDLKGSLTGLDAGLYLIETGFYREKPGRIEEGLDVVKLMVERIRKLVYDILYSAKERELDLEQSSVLQFAGDVAANIDIRIRGAGIEFQCDFKPELGMFKIDMNLLRTALMNILENAVEACIEDTSKDTHLIKFKIARKNNQVLIEIADNGSGIMKGSTKHLFDLFYSSKGHKGTGLGLFITKRVILKHGGNISVESEPGQGTKFTISIPGTKT